MVYRAKFSIKSPFIQKFLILLVEISFILCKFEINLILK